VRLAVRRRYSASERDEPLRRQVAPLDSGGYSGPLVDDRDLEIFIVGASGSTTTVGIAFVAIFIVGLDQVALNSLASAVCSARGAVRPERLGVEVAPISTKAASLGGSRVVTAAAAAAVVVVVVAVAQETDDVRGLVALVRGMLKEPNGPRALHCGSRCEASERQTTSERSSCQRD